MPGVQDVDQSIFVKKFANYLKKEKEIDVPEFCQYCKTSYGKELPPYDKDWFYTRMAAIARHLYVRGNKGVGHFRNVYGAGKRNGTRPKHHVKGSGSVARKALQALEKLQLVTINEDRGGRALTSIGRKEMDAVAIRIKMNKK